MFKAVNRKSRSRRQMCLKLTLQASKKKKEKEKILKNKSVKVNQGITNKDMLVVHRKNT